MGLSTFTLQDALNVQINQLYIWGLKLNPTIYQDLLAAVMESNKGKTDPYTICRGVDLDTFIANWHPSKRDNLRGIFGLTYKEATK